jgi:hypothetical protein
MKALKPAECTPMRAIQANQRYTVEALDLALAAAVGRTLAKDRKTRRNLFVAFFHRSR